MAAITSTFQENSAPARLPRDSSRSTRGIPPSRVPAGHMYLQNAGTGSLVAILNTMGSSITNTIRITYFSFDKIRVTRFFLSLGTGIL